MLRVAQTTASTGRAKPSTVTRSSRLRTTCSRIARPVDWSSTTITMFRAEGRTRTSALAIDPSPCLDPFVQPTPGTQDCPVTPRHITVFFTREGLLVPEERLELS